jgi:hypothetical protein
MSLNLAALGLTDDFLRHASAVCADEYSAQRDPVTRDAGSWHIAFNNTLRLSWKRGGGISWPPRDWSGEVVREDSAVVLTLTRVGYDTPWIDSRYPIPPGFATKYVITFTLRPPQM